MDKYSIRRGAGIAAGAVIGGAAAYAAAKGVGLHENADLWQKAPQDMVPLGMAAGAAAVHGAYQGLKKAHHALSKNQFK